MFALYDKVKMVARQIDLLALRRSAGGKFGS